MHAIPFQIFWTYIYEFRFPNLIIWDPFSGLKKWVQFSGLKFWGRNLEKIQGKNQKNFKVLKLFKIVPECPNVFWGVLFEKKKNCAVFQGGSSLRKNSKKMKQTFKIPKNAFNRFQKCPHVFWKCFGAIYPSFFCPVFHAGLFRFSGLKNMSSVFWTQK